MFFFLFFFFFLCVVGRRVFAFAVQACDKGVQWERAVELLERMVERDGVKPNLFAYNHAMSACVRYARNALALCFCAHARTPARQHARTLAVFTSSQSFRFFFSPKTGSVCWVVPAWA